MIGATDKVQAVLTGDLIARVVAQTSRQSGLSVVYTELLNFGGDEIYFKEEPALVGRTFGESLLPLRGFLRHGHPFCQDAAKGGASA